MSPKFFWWVATGSLVKLYWRAKNNFFGLSRQIVTIRTNGLSYTYLKIWTFWSLSEYPDLTHCPNENCTGGNNVEECFPILNRHLICNTLKFFKFQLFFSQASRIIRVFPLTEIVYGWDKCEQKWRSTKLCNCIENDLSVTNLLNWSNFRSFQFVLYRVYIKIKATVFVLVNVLSINILLYIKYFIIGSHCRMPVKYIFSFFHF